MVTNLYGGYLAATLPAKHVLSFGVVTWSLFTLLTPPAAATRALPVLLAARLVMGLGEGVSGGCSRGLLAFRCLVVPGSLAPKCPLRGGWHLGGRNQQPWCREQSCHSPP